MHSWLIWSIATAAPLAPCTSIQIPDFSSQRSLFPNQLQQQIMINKIIDYILVKSSHMTVTTDIISYYYNATTVLLREVSKNVQKDKKNSIQ